MDGPEKPRKVVSYENYSSKHRVLRITATAIEPRMNADDADTATATAIEPRINAETRGSLRGRAGSRHRGRKELGAAAGEPRAPEPDGGRGARARLAPRAE